MDRPIITLPANFLRHLDCTWDIDWRGQGAGEMISGYTRTIYAGFPRWVGEPQVFLSRAEIAQWRAIRATAQGRRGIYRVPLVDPIGFARTETGVSASTIAGGITFSGGATFSNGLGFACEPFATAPVGAAAGATSLRIDTTSAAGYVPKQGQIMSHDDWPFIVTSVTAVSGAVYDLTVQMPLRAAIAADAPVLLRGRGRFEAIEEGMGLAAYDASRVSRPTLRFMEVLRR